jgi:hypothetical protein
MRVDRISAHVRFSKDTGQGWKTVELGAEASLDPDEDWTLAGQGLYALLSAQLREVWGWGQNAPNPEPSQNGPEKPGAPTWAELESYPSPTPREERPPPREHWCPLHQVDFRRYERDGQVWYSHKASEGWCKEKIVAERS